MISKLNPVTLAFIVMLVFLFTVPVVVRALPGDFSSAGQTDGLTVGWHRRSIEVDGLRRWFRVFVPRHDMAEMPVVLLLHGGGRGMNKILSKRGGAAREWPELAKRERFLLLVPNGVNPNNGDPKGNRQHWNDLRGASSSVNSGADDVSFLLHLLRWAHTTFRTDVKRVYVTGASNGGLMTYTMLIEHPEAFAAGAAFVANLPVNAAQLRGTSRPVALMIVNGTDDPLMKYGGGAIPLGRGVVMSAKETALWWVKANGADSNQVKTSRLPDRDPGDGCRIRVTRFPAGSAEAAPVHFYTMAGAGHAMPSRKHTSPDRWVVRRLIGPQCRDAEAAEMAWSFFRQFTR